MSKIFLFILLVTMVSCREKKSKSPFMGSVQYTEMVNTNDHKVFINKDSLKNLKGLSITNKQTNKSITLNIDSAGNLHGLFILTSKNDSVKGNIYSFSSDTVLKRTEVAHRNSNQKNQVP